ncbi:MAG: anaerobic ribonucleoside-triphosphate reductase activating protein [Lachnospiraceae bacterium]|nr:anaerobic ribonucleoside-triphosphate reductase activating protein [Lachnospiraceae bacterium]MBR6697591.1 anaerobic ribonucleoside-triphosphate reductase activating protein [Lachnospiraceae bacterium]
MNYADIKQYDVANGPGVRVSLFVSGCTHHCKGCFNSVTWDFNYGNPFTQLEIDNIIKYMAPAYVSGITILGGEPFEHVNQQGLLPLLRKIREIYPNKSIWCFTGYTFDEDICNRMMNEWEETKELISYIDVLVDGKFIEELKNLSLRFRGSSNQRIIMVQESLEKGEIILWEGMNNVKN